MTIVTISNFKSFLEIAIWLKRLAYRNNPFASLYLITLLIHKEFACPMPLQSKFETYRKEFQFVVTTV